MRVDALPPVDVRPLFAPLDEQLFALLEGLNRGHWQLPTVAGQWTVQDVTAHLLDTAVRRLSALRDGHALPAPETPVTGYDSLVDHLNRLNHQWVHAMRRVSPRILVGWLREAHSELVTWLAAQDPQAPSHWAVAWAGERSSANWFDTGRELTERWLHQQQIRAAVGAPDLFDDWIYRPVLDLFLRGLPHAYRNTPGHAGSSVLLEVVGLAEGRWHLRYDEDDGWYLTSAAPTGEPQTYVRVQPDAAWRILSKSWKQPAQIWPHLQVQGDRALAEPLTRFAAVMA